MDNSWCSWKWTLIGCWRSCWNKRLSWFLFFYHNTLSFIGSLFLLGSTNIWILLSLASIFTPLQLTHVIWVFGVGTLLFGPIDYWSELWASKSVEWCSHCWLSELSYGCSRWWSSPTLLDGSTMFPLLGYVVLFVVMVSLQEFHYWSRGKWHK